MRLIICDHAGRADCLRCQICSKPHDKWPPRHCFKAGECIAADGSVIYVKVRCVAITTKAGQAAIKRMEAKP